MRKDHADMLHADMLHHAYELAELAKKETNEVARLQLLESISGSIARVLRDTAGGQMMNEVLRWSVAETSFIAPSGIDFHVHGIPFYGVNWLERIALRVLANRRRAAQISKVYEVNGELHVTLIMPEPK